MRLHRGGGGGGAASFLFWHLLIRISAFPLSFILASSRIMTKMVAFLMTFLVRLIVIRSTVLLSPFAFAFSITSHFLSSVIGDGLLIRGISFRVTVV